MNKLNIKISILAAGLLLFSSCSKSNYTASFSPSKSIALSKVENTDNLGQNDTERTAVASAGNELISMANEVNDIEFINEMPLKLTKEEFISSFTQQEMKAVKKQVRKLLYKEVKQQLFTKNKPLNDDKLIPLIVSIFIPPLGVYLYQGGITTDFWIDLVLLLTFVGSWIYAWLVIFDVISFA